nr:MAG TPA: hypothetical protein [Caudoviricetes sp.]
MSVELFDTIQIEILSQQCYYKYVPNRNTRIPLNILVGAVDKCYRPIFITFSP